MESIRSTHHLSEIERFQVFERKGLTQNGSVEYIVNVHLDKMQIRHVARVFVSHCKPEIVPVDDI